MNIHFLSYLPRSGSTLLANILAQNPRFNAAHASGMLEILFQIKNSWNNLLEHKAHPIPESKLRVMRAVLHSYHDQSKPVIIDKSRGWPAYIEMAELLLGRKIKIICCIRPIPEIVASFEKMRRAICALDQPPDEAGYFWIHQIQEGRSMIFLNPDGVIGLARNRIMDAIHRGYRDRFHFVRYDDLTCNPKNTINGVYEFLGENTFNHDFDNVCQVTKEDDSAYGYPGLHTIRQKVQPNESQALEILGSELFGRLSQLNIEV